MYNAKCKQKIRKMTRINNLFFLFVLVCIGYGVGEEYWNKDYTHYIFYVLASIIGPMIMFSRSFHTKESHYFFSKQVFMTSCISLFCIFVSLESKTFKVIDSAFYLAWVGSIMFWIFSRRYSLARKEGNDKDDDQHTNIGNGPTLA
jgi:hypothetical protein